MYNYLKEEIPKTMKNIQVRSFLLLCSGLILGACSSEAEFNKEETKESHEIILENITAEINDDALRAMDFTMGVNESGKVVPLHQFTDGATVEVNTGLSNGTAYGSATLNWKYHKGTATSKPRLVLTKGVIKLTNESNWTAGAQGWYLTGILGGTRISNSNRVTITPTTILKGVNNTSPSGSAFTLEVPYGFAWTAVTVKRSNGSAVIGDANVTFKPLGSVIGYQLGNNIGSGSTLTPTGFWVFSDGFSHAGSFDIQNPTPNKLPTFTESEGCEASMLYSFDPTTPAGTISHGATSQYRYYAWVMPRTGVTNANTRIVIKGMATGVASTAGALWKTSYNGVTVPKQHTSYTLQAKASTRVLLPIEAATEYNLAGGGELAYNSTQTPYSGPLRFANRDASGGTVADPQASNGSAYYMGYLTIPPEEGVTNTTHNPKGLNLTTASLIDLDGSTITLGSKYFIPEEEDAVGLYPDVRTSTSTSRMYFTGIYTSQNLKMTEESYRLGGRDLPIRLTSASSYTLPIVQGDNIEVYALRYMKPKQSVSTIRRFGSYVASKSGRAYYCYPLVTDNTMVCAYRYTRVGTHSYNTTGSRLRIEAMYLGEAGYNALANKTADEIAASWTTLAQKYPVITREIPAAGFTYTHNGLEHVIGQGRGARIGLSSYAGNGRFELMSSDDEWIAVGQVLYEERAPVRLFRRQP